MKSTVRWDAEWHNKKRWSHKKDEILIIFFGAVVKDLGIQLDNVKKNPPKHTDRMKFMISLLHK